MHGCNFFELQKKIDKNILAIETNSENVFIDLENTDSDS